MIFLEYGLNHHGELVHVDLARRGLTDLKCPYCNAALIARKGQIVVHHFAHAGETCRELASRKEDVFRIPFYDKFDLGVTSSELLYMHHKHYTQLWMASKASAANDKYYSLREDMSKLDQLQAPRNQVLGDARVPERLQMRGFLKWNEWNGRTGDWEFTPRGKVPVGAAILQSFAEFQLEQLIDRHRALSAPLYKAAGQKDPRQNAHLYTKAMTDEEIQAALADLNIYRAQLQRIFRASLYFLEIQHAGGILYKAGMTYRTVEERIAEIYIDLASHLSDVKITVLRQLKHRGSLEYYFKYRYRHEQHKLGSLTEYFGFEDRKKILSDLTKLKDFKPDAFWQDIIDGKPSPIELEILQEKERLAGEERRRLAKEAHREATRRGMMQAAEQGIHTGRPKLEKQDILSKYPQVIEMLQSGLGIREIVRETGVARNTVRAIRTAYEEAGEIQISNGLHFEGEEDGKGE